MRMLALMERDVRRMWRNPLTLLGAVVLPLVYLLILGNSLQGPIKGLRLGVVILDDGPQTRTLLGALQAVQNGPRTVELTLLRNPAFGMAELRQGRLAGLLIVPRHFSADLSQGLRASLGLFVDNVNSAASNALDAAVRAALPAITQPLERLERELGGAEVRTEELYPRVDYDTSLVPGVVVMAVFMGTMISGGVNLVLDRFLGVHESYLSTPLSRSDIVIGVLGAGTVVTMVTSTVVLVLGMLFTGARVHGGPLGYLAIFAILLLSSIGLLGLMMTVLGWVNHPRFVGLVGGFLNVVLFFPSGALYPIQSFPGWLRAFADVNPETHAISALKEILFRNGSLSAAGSSILFLLIFAVAMLALSTLLLKRRI